MKFFGLSHLTFALTTLVIALAAVGLSQDPLSITDKKSTEERVATSSWWPTKQLPSSQKYAGAGTCGQCHSSIYETQSKTAMARTAMAADKSDIVRPDTSIRMGLYTYKVTRSSSGLALEISDGSHSITKPLSWAFGDGSVGQSYLSQEGDEFLEARFTYFPSLHSFDSTPGRIRGAPVTRDMASGRPVSEQEVRKCFACHTTGMTDAPGIHPEALTMGVTCEACHGPGADHVDDPTAASSAQHRAIFNPHVLSPTDSVDFCGSCHGTWWDVELMGAIGVETVRFPAYRLQKSRCWGQGDTRLICTACHDPHQPLEHEAAAYDHNCLSCHVTKGAKSTNRHPGTVCPVAGRNCVTCHMTKYQIPDMHAKFTDHEIRIVHTGEQFPD